MSIIADLCQQLYDTGWATAIRESEVVFPAIETAHVLALTLMVGTIAIVDFRLLGVAYPNVPAATVERKLVPVTWIGFAIMAGSGALLFAAEAAKIQHNPAFQAKLALLLLAGINMLAFHFGARAHLRDEVAGEPRAVARLSALLSLVLWSGVIAAGRAIAYF